MNVSREHWYDVVMTQDLRLNERNSAIFTFDKTTLWVLVAFSY